MANNIQVNKIDTSGQECWNVSYNLDTVGTKTGILKTAGTLLDRNIKLNISTNSILVPSNITFSVINDTNANTSILNKGRIDIEQSSSSAGLITLNAYNDATTPSLTGVQTIIENGEWKYSTVTVNNTKQGPFYGAIYVNPISEAGEAAPTTSYDQNGLTTYFTKVAFEETHEVTITPQFSNSTAGYLGVKTNINNGGEEYWQLTRANIIETATTVSGTRATRGKVSMNAAGWFTKNEFNDKKFSKTANFRNSPATNTVYTDYVDISGTTAAPILTSPSSSDASKGYLYITAGYVDNLRISLAKLIPDGANISPVNTNQSDKILNGYSAYDKDGNLLAGNIPEKTRSDITALDNVITIPEGYYRSDIPYSMPMAEARVSGTTTLPKPTIIRTSTSASGATNVGSGIASTNKPSSGYFVSFTAAMADINIPLTPNITTTGYLKEANQIICSASATAQATDEYYLSLPTAAARVNGSKPATKPTIARKPKTLSGATDVGYGDVSPDEPSSGYFISFQATAPITNITLTPTIATAGYLKQASQITGTASTIAQDGDIYYLPMTGIKLTPPSSGSRTFKVIVPNGDTSHYIDFVFEVQYDGTVVIDSTGKDLDGTTNLP